MGVGVLHPFPLILATIIIMADLKNHIFPLFLKGEPVTVADTGALPIDVSFIKLEPASDGVSYTLPDGTIPGQMMVLFNNTSANDADITVTTALDDDAATIALDTLGTTVTLMWVGTAWVVLAGEGASSLT